MSKKFRSRLITIFLTMVVLVGFSVMFYPTFSDWWNTREQRAAIASYERVVQEVKPEDYSKFFDAADKYNRNLLTLANPFKDYDTIRGYDTSIDISGTGIMGYITIPFIDVELPIYHGTSPEVLNIAAGHLEGSSLPVGGANTHAVISAHRGLPSARLFTDLDKLAEGDTFTITVLDRVLTYEIEKILTVKPEEIDKLSVIPGGDYVTLMTCTPYGINTHRLLLRSKRIDTVEVHKVKVYADMVKVDPLYSVPFIAAPLFLILIIAWTVSGRIKRLTPRQYADKIISEERK